tara:strand:- start:422 stop:1090 length:669 start_codon:yes stop_codon:yes gene_type:complete
MSNYFSKIPDFEYVSRLPDAKIGDYIVVKNLFKRGFLREDIFQNLSVFEKYQINGNDRPDNVAFDFYNNSNLDWLVLTCNNILNVQTEWPLRQDDLDRFLLDKYGNYDTLFNGVHHYETVEIKDTNKVTILPAGMQVDSNFSISYFDQNLGTVVTSSNVKEEVTNYQYEDDLQTDKRNLFLLKPRYLNLVLDDLEDMMLYKKGSTQYKSETLKTAEDIRIYN